MTVLMMGLALSLNAQAATKVLVVGSISNLYHNYYSNDTAFDPSGVATQLKAILEADSAVSQPVTVQIVNIASTLASWYYWPGASYANLGSYVANRALLRQGWDYVVTIDDPYWTITYPQLHFDGLLGICAEAAKGGAKTIDVMTWSSGTNALTTFENATWRAADGAGAAVAPAGTAWANVPAGIKDAGARPTPRGAYVTASTVYSRMFNRSAKSSVYVPSFTATQVRDQLADTAFSTVTAEDVKTHYTGKIGGEMGFVTPVCSKRQVSIEVVGTSTESGLSGPVNNGFIRCGMAPGGPLPYDITLSRSYNPYHASPYVFTFDFELDSGGKSMICDLEYGLANAFEGIKRDKAYYAFNSRIVFSPMRLLWAKIRTEYPEIPLQADTTDQHHLSEFMNFAMGAVYPTLLTGRCPLYDEPAERGTRAWKIWYCLKTGYETAWQLASMNARVPGFQVLPSNNSVTNLTPAGSDFLTVKFYYPPTNSVSVAVSVDWPENALVSPARLDFTPWNYGKPQKIYLKALPGAAANAPVTVRLRTVSSDPVFDGLTDEWAYNVARGAVTQAVAVVQRGTNVLTVAEDTPTTIPLGVAGAASGNTVATAPAHGTFAFVGTNATYTPATNYYGPDSFLYAVTINGTTTVWCAALTVTNVPDPVALVSPTNNAAYVQFAGVPLSVSGFWGDGRVDYYDGATLLGSLGHAPWSMVWSNAAPGAHAISAVAYDGLGGSATSATVYISVAADSNFWLADHSGTWSESGNWYGGVPPGESATALFNHVDIAGAITVRLDRATTVGGLVFGDLNPEMLSCVIGPDNIGHAILTNSPAMWVVSDGGNPLNKLDLRSAGPATVQVDSLGNLPIPMPYHSGDFAATIDATLMSGSGLLKTGPGELILPRNNLIYGDITITNGGILVGTDGALGRGTVTMYENSWLGCVDDAGVNWTLTNNIVLRGKQVSKYRLGCGIGARMTFAGSLDGSGMAPGSTLLFGGRGSTQVLGSDSDPGIRIERDALATNYNVSLGAINVSNSDISVLGDWPCQPYESYESRCVTSFMGGTVNARNMLLNVYGMPNFSVNFGGDVRVNLSGNVGGAGFRYETHHTVTIGDTAQINVGGTFYAHDVSLTITDQASLKAKTLVVGGASNFDRSTARFSGGVVEVQNISYAGQGSLNFNGSLIRAGASTNNFIAALKASVEGGGLLLDTAGYDVTVTQALTHASVAVDGGLCKLGLGRLTLCGAGSFNGPVSVEGGSLELAGVNAIGGTDRVRIGSNAELRVSAANVMSNSVVLTVSESGRLYLTNGVNMSVAGLLVGGQMREAGTWGATGSGAAHTDDVHFSGKGVLTVTGLATANGSWIANANGAWNASSNWLGNTVAYGPGSTAYFTNVITAARTVTLPAACVLGNLVFGSTSNALVYTLAGGSLWLTNNSATPVINVTTGTTTISTVLMGDQGFVKNGRGTLFLNGKNTIQGLVDIAAGKIQLNGSILTPLPSGAAVRVASNAMLHLYFGRHTLGALDARAGSSVYLDRAMLTLALDADTVCAGLISGTGILIKDGEGALTLTAANTFAGPVQVINGTLVLQVTNALKNATSVTVGPHGVLRVLCNGAINSNATVNIQAGGTVWLAPGVSLKTAGILFDGVPAAEGTWGGIGSGAEHEDARFQGGGVIFSMSDAAGDGVWISGADGKWTTTGAWKNGVMAYGAGRTATFTNANNATRVVALDAGRLVDIGTLAYGSPSNDWTLYGSFLNLTNNGTAAPVIAVATNSATLACRLEGSQGLRKTGAGTLEIVTVGSCAGPTLVDEGTLLLAGQPAGLPDLGLWIDASDAASLTVDGAGRVSGWLDKSGNGRNFAVPTNGVNQPSYTLGAMNGLPVVRFGGTEAIAYTGKLWHAYTILSVSRLTGTQNGRLIGDTSGSYSIGYGLNGSCAAFEPFWASSAGADQNVHIYSAGYEAGDAWLYDCHNLVGSRFFYDGYGDPLGLRLGAASTNSLCAGDVGEILAYPRALSAGELSRVVDYLDHKWRSGGDVSYGSNYLSAASDVTLGGNAVFALENIDQTVASLTGSSASRLRLRNAQSVLRINATLPSAFPGVIECAGTVIKRGASAWTLSGAGNIINGKLCVEDGSLVLAAPCSFQTLSNLVVASGGILDVSGLTGGRFSVGAGQQLSGGGVVSGSVLNAGRVVPEGDLKVNGAYTQSAGGEWVVRIQGPNRASRLIVTGAATLAGTITVDAGTYWPQLGDSFTIATASGFSGAFSSFNLPILPAGWTWILKDSGNTLTLMIGNGTQTITFPNPGDQVVTNVVTLGATALSGLQVSYRVVSGPATLTGSTLSFTGAGSVSVVASQTGDAIWNAAVSVTNTFMVTKVPATVTLGNLAQTYTGSPRPVTVTTTPGGLAVDVTYAGSPTPPTAVGSYAVAAAVNSLMYEAVANGTLVVGNGVQTIAFPNPGDQVAANVVTLGATASSGLQVSYRVVSGPATLTGASTLTFTGAGSVSVAASQAGNTNWNVAVSVTNTFAVTVAAVAPATCTWNGGEAGVWSNGAAGWTTNGVAATWANSNEALFTGTVPTNVTVAGAGVSVSTNNPALSITSGSYSFSGGNIAVGGNGRVTVSPGASASFANLLTGSGFAYYNGTLTLSGGIAQTSTHLYFGNDAASTIAQNGGTVETTYGNRTIYMGVSGTASSYTISDGTLQGVPRSGTDVNPSLHLRGGSTLTINGGVVNAPYELRTEHPGTRITLAGGVLRGGKIVGNANATGSTTLEITSGTFQPYDSDMTVARRNSANLFSIVLTGSDGVISSNDKNGIARIVRIGGSVVGTSDGGPIPIGQSGGSRALTFTGNGTNILSGTNTYTGKTTIQAGTLLLLASASLTNSAEIAVQSGAVFDVSAPGGITFHSGKTLSGNGTVLGNVTMGSGAVVVPGSNGVGKLTMTNVTVKAGSKVSMEVTGVAQAGVDFDQVKGVSGSTLTYESGWTLELDFKTFGASVVGSYVVKLFDFPNYSGTGNVPTITLASGSSVPKTYSFNPTTGELSFSNPPKVTVISIQ